jgi:hypothetical protein
MTKIDILKTCAQPDYYIKLCLSKKCIKAHKNEQGDKKCQKSKIQRL